MQSRVDRQNTTKVTCCAAQGSSTTEELQNRGDKKSERMDLMVQA